MLKIAIVDDDPRLSRNLRSELLNYPEIDYVLCHTSGLAFGGELKKMSPEKRPEIILMDISMGSPNEGVLATSEIKTNFPDIEVIMFTISDEDEMIFESLKAGAVGYLLKNEHPSFILKTLLDVKNGGTQMSPGIARKAISFFSGRNVKNEEQQKLSDRETELLRLVGNGMTYDKIADKLSISLNTVKSHMTNIFKKLQVNNKVEALRKMGGL